ncbi:hypothetical protein N9Z53_01550 [Mariniblastus sp.]|nr:hypothetical protein [Mariniblastus sp.]
MLNPVLRTQLFKLADKIKNDLNGNFIGPNRHELEFWRIDQKELAAFSQLIQASLNLSVPPFKVVDGGFCRLLETLNPLTIGIETEPDSWAVARIARSFGEDDYEEEVPFPLKPRGKYLIMERIDHWLDLIEQDELSVVTPVQAVAPEEAEPHLTTDELLTELFHRNPSAKKWTQRDLAEAINRGKTSVADSPIYKQVRAEIDQCKPLSDAKLFGSNI